MESYYNWARAVSPPPKNGINVEGCGWYIVKKMKAGHHTPTIIFGKTT